MTTAEQKRIWAEKNREKVLKSKREHYLRNKEKWKEYYESKKGDPDFIEKRKIQSKKTKKRPPSNAAKVKLAEWYVKNKEYVAATSKKRIEEYNSRILNPRNGPFSEKEIILLKRTDLSVKTMSLILQRTYSSVINKRYELKKQGLI